LPHAALAVPSSHVLPLQQPNAQLVGLHAPVEPPAVAPVPPVPPAVAPLPPAVAPVPPAVAPVPPAVAPLPPAVEPEPPAAAFPHSPATHCCVFVHAVQRAPFTPHASGVPPGRQMPSSPQHPPQVVEEQG